MPNSNEWYTRYAKDVATALARGKKAKQEEAIPCTLVKMGDGSHLLCAGVSDAKAGALVKEARHYGGKVLSSGSLYLGTEGVTFAVTEGSTGVKKQFADAAVVATGKAMHVTILTVPPATAPVTEGQVVPATPAPGGPPPDFSARAGRLVAAVKQAPPDRQQALQAILAQALVLAKSGKYGDAEPLLKQVEDGVVGGAPPPTPSGAPGGEPPPPPGPPDKDPDAPSEPSEKAIFTQRLMAIQPRYQHVISTDPPNKAVLTRAMAAVIKAAKDGDYGRGLQILDGLEQALGVQERRLAEQQKETKKLFDKLPKIGPDDAPVDGPSAPAMGEQAGAIVSRLNALYNPPAVVPPELAEANDGERKPVDDARRQVFDLLNQPLSAEVIRQASGVLASVGNLIQQAATAVRDRLTKEAQAIRDDPAMKDAVPEALEGEMTPVLDARAAVTKALETDPLTGAAVQKARDALGGVKKVLEEAAKTVRERLDAAAEKILGDDLMKAEVPDATTEELADVTDARRQVTDALKPPRTNGGLTAATDALKLLGPALEKARQAVAERLTKEAENIRGDEAMKQTIDDAIEEDLKDLKAAREKVLAALPEKPTGLDIKNATDRLNAVKLALVEAKSKVQARLKNEADKILATIATDQPLGQDPDGTPPKQVQKLAEARTAVRKPLTQEPRTAVLLEEGKKAHDALEKLHKAVLAGIQRMGGPEKAKALYNDVGKDKLEALETAFGIDDPEKLADLLADLGGKDALTKLVAAFTNPADLKAASDALGGPKNLETAMRVGCGADAGKMKKLLDAFSTTEKQQLKDLVEKGGMAARPEVLGQTIKAAFATADEKARRAEADRLDGVARTNYEAAMKAHGLAVKAWHATGAVPPPPAVPAKPVPTDPATVVVPLLQQQAAETSAIAGFKDLATAFAADDDRKRLASMLETGGLGANPATLGALLQTGCGGDANKLKDFAAAYPVPDPAQLALGHRGAKAQKQALEDLQGVLTDGGLGERPEVFAHLFASGVKEQPRALKQFCTAFRSPADRDKLRTLTRNGLGGTDGESPDRLALAYRKGLAKDPARLKELHDAFNVPPPPGPPPPGADLVKLQQVMGAVGAEPPPGRSGRRFRELLADLGQPGAIGKLKTEFDKKIVKASRGGGGPALRDAVAGEPATMKALTRAAEAEALDGPTASAETKSAVAASREAAEAAATAAWAGADPLATDPDATAVWKAARKAANAAAKAARLGADPDGSAAAALAELDKEVRAAGTFTVVDQEVQNRALAANNAAQQAALAANQAALAANQAAALAAQPNATPTQINDAKTRAADAAAKAAAASAAAAKATDPAVVKSTLAAAADAAKAAAAAAQAAAVKYAAARAGREQTTAKNLLSAPATGSDKSAALDAAGAATLAAIVASDAGARSAAVKAAQAEAAARANAADPGATPQEVAAARAAAKAAADLAADEAARAAAAAAQAALATVSTLPLTAVTADQVAAAVAAADAATAAAFNAPPGANRTQAQAHARALYAAAISAGAAAPTPPPPATPNLPVKRRLAGAARLQQSKAEKGLFNSQYGVPPAPLEDVFRVGATMRKQDLTSITAVPALGKSPSGEDNKADLDHICGRHTRDYFTFDPTELVPMDKLADGMLAEGGTSGLTNNQKTNQQKNAIKDAKKAKKTTLFPDGVGETEIKRFIEEAVGEILTGNYHDVNGQTTVAGGVLTFTAPTGYGKWEHVPVDGGRLTVFVGIAKEANHFLVRQLYPDGGADLDTFNPADMHAIKGARGF